MWEQPNDKTRPEIPPVKRDVLMVNARGRVIAVASTDVQKLIGEGFRFAPAGLKVAEFIPVFDRGDKWKNESFLAPDIEEQLSSDTLEVIKI